MNFIFVETLTFLYKDNCIASSYVNYLIFFPISDSSFCNSIPEMRCQPNAQNFTN